MRTQIFMIGMTRNDLSIGEAPGFKVFVVQFVNQQRRQAACCERTEDRKQSFTGRKPSSNDNAQKLFELTSMGKYGTRIFMMVMIEWIGIRSDSDQD